MTKCNLSCADCAVLACRSKNEDKYPEFCLTSAADPKLVADALDEYRQHEELLRLARVSACIEGEFYGRMTRVEETLGLIKRMGYKKIGIASCVGLIKETRIFTRILKSRGIDYFVVGCKIGAIDKSAVGVPEDKKLNHGCGHESMCNPILQAKTLAAEHTDFNILIGLCVGHDALFLKYSEAPTTVLAAKDRVLQHNTIAALYGATSMYSRFKQDIKVI